MFAELDILAAVTPGTDKSDHVAVALRAYLNRHAAKIKKARQLMR